MADVAIIAEEHVLTHWDSERGAQPFKLFVAQQKPHLQGEDKIKDTANLKSKKMFF